MSSSRSEQLKAIFTDAIELPSGARREFLDRACAAEPALRAEVESLLAIEQTASSSFMHAPAFRPSDAADDGLLPSAANIPQRIGRYVVLRKLGEGGMGVVFEARQENPARTVAVKLIRSILATPSVRRRFEKEAQLLGQLQHPGIATVYEAGTAEVVFDVASAVAQPYFAMELVKGIQLHDFVVREKLNVRGILELFLQVCDAVRHAHERGVIHRDLKPPNILVDNDGQAKILDFGVARLADAEARATTLQTDAGQLVGTLQYMSPEQVQGTGKEVDARADVYALGVILYQLLSRRTPLDLEGRSIPEAARMIQETDPTRLGSIDRALRGDLETIVAKALEKDRDHRYASAAELGADIRRFLHDDPIVARPASAIYQMRKFARRHRGVAVGVCIAVLALIAGSAVAFWQALEARSAQRVAEQRFADLNGFAHSVILDYPKLQDMKGETKAREFLTKTTLQYLDGMARDTRGLDLKILRDLALAYSATGDILGRPNGPNLGDPKASLESYRKSTVLLDDLVARAPDNIEFKRDLAITCERIGNLHLQDQQYDQALDVVRKAHDLKLAVADKHEQGPRDLSFSYSKLGDVYIKMGRFEEAYDVYNRSLIIRKQLAESKPDDGEIQRAYTVGLNRVADVLLELHKDAEALELVQTSLRRRVDRANSQPDSAHAAFDLGNGHFKLAQVLARAGRLDEALPAFESARAVLLRLAEKDPSNTTARTGAAEVSGELGRVLFEAGRFGEALPELTACTKETEQAMPDNKLTSGLREQLASGHHRRGKAHLALAHAEGATTEQSHLQEVEGCAALRRAAQLYESLGDNGLRVPPELRGELEECETSDGVR